MRIIIEIDAGLGEHEAETTKRIADDIRERLHESDLFELFLDEETEPDYEDDVHFIAAWNPSAF